MAVAQAVAEAQAADAQAVAAQATAGAPGAGAEVPELGLVALTAGGQGNADDGEGAVAEEEIPCAAVEVATPQVIRVARFWDGQWEFHEEEHHDRELSRLRRLCEQLVDSAKVSSNHIVKICCIVTCQQASM